MPFGKVVTGQPRELQRQNCLVRQWLRLRIHQEVALGDVLGRDPARLGDLEPGAVDLGLPAVARLALHQHLTAGNHEQRMFGSHRERVRRRHRREREQLTVEIAHLHGGHPMGPPVVAQHAVADPDRLDRSQVAVGHGDEFAGRQAPFHVVHIGALVGDDQGAFELAHVLGVDPEVRLQRDVDVHARWHVDERAARPHRGVQRGELVVAGWDHGAEVLLEDLRVFLQRRVGVQEDHALGLQILADLVVDDLGVVRDQPFGHEVVRSVNLDVIDRLDSIRLDGLHSLEAQPVIAVSPNRGAVGAIGGVRVAAATESSRALRVPAAQLLELTGDP